MRIFRSVGGRTPGPIASGGEGRRTTRPGPLGFGAGSAQGPATYLSFKQAVFDRQLANARAAGRPYFPAIPGNELEIVEGHFRMRIAAAQDCRALLAAARAALSTAKAAGQVQAIKVVGFGVRSAYRDYSQDMLAWDSAFKTHYDRTRPDREAAPGGAHGPAAVLLLVREMQKYKAVPGFSNHSNGTAVDFETTEAGVTYAAQSSQRAGWRGTWLHAWLVANANTYGFKPLATEEWHWDHP
jgi:LAS superfamily LD-carboxypeptidase LdcB